MNPVVCSPDTLKQLPDAIWVAGTSKRLPSVYRGEPIEMVRQMAAEMNPNISATDAIRVLVNALAAHRRIFIGLPNNVPDEVLAGLFIYALLDLGVSRPMPEA